MPTIWIRLKFWIFRHYIAIFLATLILCIITAFVFAGAKWELRFAILGVPFTAIYFLQKQKMEELDLFKKLFTEFNERYDRYNDRLNEIYAGDQNTPLDADQRQILFDYFNLCGEEYLFYQQGYIFPEVWASWYNGMKFFLQNERIKQVWEEELANDSYYGLSFDQPEAVAPAVVPKVSPFSPPSVPAKQRPLKLLCIKS